MRKVVLYQLLSLDGVAEEPGDWLFDAGDALVDNLGRVIQEQDAVLLGRNTYDYWLGYWPTSDYQPFASFINQTPKHVFSSGTSSEAWSESTFVATPVVDYVNDLISQSGADIGIHGSIALAQSLLRAQLVDELRLLIAPSIAGHGKRLFTEDGTLQTFDLLDVERTASGTLLLGYRARPRRRSWIEGAAPEAHGEAACSSRWGRASEQAGVSHRCDLDVAPAR